MAPEISNTIDSNQLRNSSNISKSMTRPSYMPSQATRATAAPTPPPPLPPRHPVQNYPRLYNDYRPPGSGYYENYGYDGSYRGYGGYNYLGNHTPYTNTYNSYGQFGRNSMESRFQQYAEENTRSSFHVIETILHTFSSITMVLESTYFALTNSFRAILNVADNIGRLRSTIGQLFSTFALIRFLKWIYKKTLFMLGLQKQNAIDEDLWHQSVSQVVNKNNGGMYATSMWTNFLLCAVFAAIPYLIHKITNNMRQMQIQVNNPKSWLKCEDPVQVATAMYDFTATSNDELCMRTGQKIWLAPRSIQSKNMPGWLLATDNKNVGFVPANYINITGQLKPKLQSDGSTIASAQIPNTVQNATDPVDHEATHINILESEFNQQNTISSEDNIKDDALQFE